MPNYARGWEAGESNMLLRGGNRWASAICQGWRQAGESTLIGEEIDGRVQCPNRHDTHQGLLLHLLAELPFFVYTMNVNENAYVSDRLLNQITRLERVP